MVTAGLTASADSDLLFARSVVSCDASWRAEQIDMEAMRVLEGCRARAEEVRVG